MSPISLSCLSSSFCRYAIIPLTAEVSVSPLSLGTSVIPSGETDTLSTLDAVSLLVTSATANTRTNLPALCSIELGRTSLFSVTTIDCTTVGSPSPSIFDTVQSSSSPSESAGVMLSSMTRLLKSPANVDTNSSDAEL